MKASQWPFRLVLGLVFSLTIQSHASAKLQGTVKVDGSSTVFPITEAVAEEFSKIQPRVRVTVGVSGTGGGFKKFTVGETDINDASRPIKDKEVKVAKEKKVEYIQIPVAYDGISVVINPKNTWVDYLTVDELKKIWNTGSKVSTWKDIRSAWPDKKIVLHGPGTDSGTFDYFTEEINGKSQASRSDFTKSEDDNTLVQGVAGDEGAMGYFGFSYYIENKDKLKAVGIKNKGAKAAVAPTVDSINKGTYAPLSRPIFIYVSKASLNKPEVKAFVEFYIQNAAKLSKETGYVPLPAKMYEKSLAEIKSVKTRVL